MITRDQLVAMMSRECDLCVHLHSKIPPGSMDFRFTPPQRSTAELLRYLSFIGLGAVRSMAAGNWEPYVALDKEAAKLDPKDFPAAMARQKAALRAALAEISDDDFRRKSFAQPWGVTVPLGQAIVELGYASLVAYRMQLFLHAKAAGNASIGTSNCWGGMDEPPK